MMWSGVNLLYNTITTNLMIRAFLMFFNGGQSVIVATVKKNILFFPHITSHFRVATCLAEHYAFLFHQT